MFQNCDVIKQFGNGNHIQIKRKLQDMIILSSYICFFVEFNFTFYNYHI